MRVRFFLRDPHAPNDVAVQAIARWVVRWGESHKVKFSTGVVVPVKAWDQKKCRAKRGYLHETSVNERLSRIESLLVSIAVRRRNTGEPLTPEAIRQEFEEKDGRTAPQRADLWSVWQGFMDHIAAVRRQSTVSQYEALKVHLERFEKETGDGLTWQRISVEFLREFVRMLSREQATSTVRKNITLLKTFLFFADREGKAPPNVQHALKQKIHSPAVPTVPGIYLTPEELAAVDALADMTEAEGKAWSLFRFQCETFLRFSDVVKIGREHIQGGDLVVTHEKTSKTVRIPLSPTARGILAKNGGRLPRLSLTYTNTLLQKLAKRAGITSPVVVITFKGGKRLERTVEKGELLSSHAAKRTAITLARKRGLSLEAIMLLSGNTRETIDRYISFTAEDAGREYAALFTDCTQPTAQHYATTPE